MSGHLEFVGSAGRPVRADFHPAADPRAPVVVLIHGFKGFRAWGFWPHIADRLAAGGFHALRIDFSHNGVQDRDFDRLDLFALDTGTRHQEDLAAVVAALHRPGGWPWEGSPSSIALLGHSRGGADALLFAAREPRIAAVATLAAVVDLAQSFGDVEPMLRALGYVPIENSRTKQTMPVALPFFEDAPRHDVLEAARSLSDRPLLVAHGDEDDAVPVADAHAIAGAHGRATCLIVPGTGHTFGAGHPWGGTNPHLEQVLERVISFYGSTISRRH